MTRIKLRHDQILLACYEWAVTRGFTPDSVTAMTVRQGDDLVNVTTGERKERFEMIIECAEASGQTYRGASGDLYPYVARSEVPWLKQVQGNPANGN